MKKNYPVMFTMRLITLRLYDFKYRPYGPGLFRIIVIQPNINTRFGRFLYTQSYDNIIFRRICVIKIQFVYTHNTVQIIFPLESREDPSIFLCCHHHGSKIFVLFGTYTYNIMRNIMQQAFGAIKIILHYYMFK